MKKWIKPLIYSTSFLAVLAFVVSFSFNWSNTESVSCVGSSGVKPFVEAFGNKYSQCTEKVDVTVDAGGSGFGISQIANGFTDIGNASKNPYSTVKTSHKDKWIQREIKTVTVGWEGICVLYIPPHNLTSYKTEYLNSILNLNEQNITNLYRIFSGFDDGVLNRTMSSFSDDNNIKAEDKTLFAQTNILPYVRSGGSMTSGTAASFYKSSHFDDCHVGLTPDQDNAFETGNYGKDIKLIDTDEANSRAWDIFNKNHIVGSMIYLSSGFVEQNKDLIEQNNIGILEYDSHPYKVDEIKNNFKFYRPLNIMLTINDNSAKKFVEYMLDENSKELWKTMGAQQVSSADKTSMSSGTNLWISDEKIMEERGHDWSYADNIFGALDQ